MRRFSWLAAAIPFAVAAACSSSAERASSTSGSGGAGGQATTSSSRASGGFAGEGGGSTAHSSGAAGSAGGLTDGGFDASDGATFDCNVLGEPGDCLMTSDCSTMPLHASWPGYCPGSSDIECCIGDTTLLCDPSKTPHPNAGNTTEAAGKGGCPDGMLLVTTFCVDMFEASLLRADNGTSWSPFFNPGTTSVIAVSVANAVPQAYIDQIQAGDACTNAGKRLCTDAEWLRACQGPGGDTYPYGDTLEPGVCNDHRALHPAEEYFGSTDSSVFTMLDNPCIDQLPETVDLTGSNAGCVTAEGAFDMMGNVHEWTADAAGSFRGGYYVDTVENGPGCLYVTTAHDTSYWDYSTGFRCCADP